MRNRPCVLAAALAWGACSKPAVELPAPADEPAAAQALWRSLPETIPGYGIALDGNSPRFEVNIEAADTPSLRVGERATVFVPPDRRPIPARVTRVLPNASAETGESLAWLTPEGASPAPPNEFVYASITTSVKRHALAVPESAVLVRDGKTCVVEKSGGPAGAAWRPVEVETGASADGYIQILKGLDAGATVAASGAIGWLYPDFKASAGD